MFSFMPNSGLFPDNEVSPRSGKGTSALMKVLEDAIKQRMDDTHEEDASPDHVPRWGNTDDTGA